MKGGRKKCKYNAPRHKTCKLKYQRTLLHCIQKKVSSKLLVSHLFHVALQMAFNISYGHPVARSQRPLRKAMQLLHSTNLFCEMPPIPLVHLNKETFE